MTAVNMNVKKPAYNPQPPLYEFACHEQNYGMMNVVKGAQVREAEAARHKN